MRNLNSYFCSENGTSGNNYVRQHGPFSAVGCGYFVTVNEHRKYNEYNMCNVTQDSKLIEFFSFAKVALTVGK